MPSHFHAASGINFPRIRKICRGEGNVEKRSAVLAFMDYGIQPKASKWGIGRKGRVDKTVRLAKV